MRNGTCPRDKPLLVAGLDEDSTGAIINVHRRRSRPKCDDQQSRSERLKRDVAKSLGQAREQKRVG